MPSGHAGTGHAGLPVGDWGRAAGMAARGSAYHGGRCGPRPGPAAARGHRDGVHGARCRRHVRGRGAHRATGHRGAVRRRAGHDQQPLGERARPTQAARHHGADARPGGGVDHARHPARALPRGRHHGVRRRHDDRGLRPALRSARLSPRHGRLHAVLLHPVLAGHPGPAAVADRRGRGGHRVHLAAAGRPPRAAGAHAGPPAPGVPGPPARPRRGGRRGAHRRERRRPRRGQARRAAQARAPQRHRPAPRRRHRPAPGRRAGGRRPGHQLRRGPPPPHRWGRQRPRHARARRRTGRGAPRRVDVAAGPGRSAGRRRHPPQPPRRAARSRGGDRDGDPAVDGPRAPRLRAAQRRHHRRGARARRPCPAGGVRRDPAGRRAGRDRPARRAHAPPRAAPPSRPTPTRTATTRTPTTRTPAGRRACC